MAVKYSLLDPFAEKSFPGSSGYWGWQGSNTGPNSIRVPGLGYPGDVARARAGIPTIDPSVIGGRFTLPKDRAQAGDPLYKARQVLKSPGVAAGAKGLMDRFNAGTGDIPGFDDFLKQQTGAMKDITDAYGRQKQSFDLSGYSAGQRAADAAASGLTGDYANTSRAIGEKYAGSDAEYAQQLRDIIARANAGLADYDKAANAIGDEQTQQLLGQISRYKIGGGNLGVGSDELRKIARGVGDIRLPLEREKIAKRYDLLTGLELPADREIATRNAARYTGFDLPVEQQIYGAKQGDILRSKQTESQLKNLEMSVAGMSSAAAEQYLKSLSLPVELIQQILQRHNQTLAGKIGNLSGLGSLEDQAYYRGLEYTPGASLTSPQYYSPNLGGYPDYTPMPSRYGDVPSSAGSMQKTPTRLDDPWYDRYNEPRVSLVPERYPALPLNTDSGPAGSRNYGSGGGYTISQDGSYNWLGSYANNTPYQEYLPDE